MGTPAPNGNLTRYGLVKLLNDVLSEKCDGVLRLSISDLTVRLYLVRGTPVFCVSSSPEYSLPAFLVRQRAVDRDVLDEVVDRARRERKRLDEMLREEKLVGSFQMSAIKQSLGQSILSSLFDQTELNYHLDGGQLPSGMETLSLDPARAFFRSLRDDDVFDLDNALGAQVNHFLLKGPEWDAHTRSLTSVFRTAEDMMVQLADGTATLAMLTGALDSSDCSRLVFAMLQTGMITLGEQDGSIEPDEDVVDETGSETEEEPASSAVTPKAESSAFFLDDGSVENEIAKLAGDLQAGLVSADDEKPSAPSKKRRGRDSDEAGVGIAVTAHSATQTQEESGRPSSTQDIPSERDAPDMAPLPAEEVSAKEAVAPPAPAKEAVAPPAPAKEAVAPPAPKKEAVAPPAPKKEAVAPPAPKKEAVAPPAPKREAVAPPAPKKEAPPPKKKEAPPAKDESPAAASEVDGFDEEDPSDLLSEFMEEPEPSADLLNELTAAVTASGGKAEPKQSKSRPKRARGKGFGSDDLHDDPILQGVAKDRIRMVEQSAFRILGVSPGACLSEIRESHKKLKAQYEVGKYEGRYLPDSSREDLAVITDRLNDVLRELCVPARRLALEAKESGPLGKKRIVRYFQAEQLYQKGRQQYRGNQKRQALKAFRAAAAQYDRDPAYQAWCGFVLWELLEDEAHSGVEGRVKVREYLAAALALNENFSMALLLSARLARHEGDTDTAIEMYDRVLEVNPRSVEARNAIRELEGVTEARATSKAKEKLTGLFRRKKD